MINHWLGNLPGVVILTILCVVMLRLLRSRTRQMAEFQRRMKESDNETRKLGEKILKDIQKISGLFPKAGGEAMSASVHTEKPYG